MATTFDSMGVPEPVQKLGFSLSGFERDLVMLNRQDGTFLDISGVSGADSVSDGRSGIYADFDNDGDFDIFITAHPSKMRRRHERTQFLFRNNIGQDQGYIRVSLEGKEAGTDAWGAVIRIKTSAGILTKMKSAGSGFLAQSDPRLLFGLGDDVEAEWMEVTWPGGSTQRFPNPKAGTSWKWTQGESTPVPVQEKKTRLPDPIPNANRHWRSLAIKKGQVLPALSLVDHQGNKFSLPSLHQEGRPTLVHFWATWCSSCAQEMRELQRLHAKWEKDGGPRVIGISVDGADTQLLINDFLRKARVEYPIYLANQEELDQIFLRGEIGVPLSLFLDKNGKVQEALTGWSQRMRIRLEELANSEGSR